MVPELPDTKTSPDRLASPSPSRSTSKRPLSSPVSSSTPNKRANSEDYLITTSSNSTMKEGSDTEGSFGVSSRLKIDSTPNSPSSASQEDDDDQEEDLPNYDQVNTTTSSNRPPGEVQFEIIKELKASLPSDGEDWYLISSKWYKRWLTAVTGTVQSKDLDDQSIQVDQVGPIDNQDLKDTPQSGELKKPLTEGVEIELLPDSAYNLLKEWYGSIGPDYSRSVVNGRVEFYPPNFKLFLLVPSDSTSSTSLPLQPPPQISLTSTTPFSTLQKFAQEAFNLEGGEESRSIRLWRLPESDPDPVSSDQGPAYVLSDKLRENGVELLEFNPQIQANQEEGEEEEGPFTLEDGLLTDSETRIAIEQQQEDGSWIVDSEEILAFLAARGVDTPSSLDNNVVEQQEQEQQTPETSLTNTFKEKSKGLFGNGWHTTLHKPKSTLTPTTSSTTSNNNGLMSQITGALTRSKTASHNKGQRGLVGLSNLGNTCFMNSAIQCMSNTKELKEYFLSGAYKDELNPDNPLGMRGQVAEAFGQLIERMWHGSSGSVAPREFKQAVSRFAPQFSGYGQQDSQELLAFLLDGTHEDLNRILKKPPTTAPDWKQGGGDSELVEMAKTCWQQYRSRNDSVIVDLFQGQYRSTVVCPDCDRVSITFDPFMYVTTNLPVMKKWTGTVYVIPKDHSKTVIKLELEVPKNGTLKTLKTCVGKILSMDPKSLVVTEEWHHKFWKEWPDEDSITELNTGSDKILIYETSSDRISQPRFRKNKNQDSTTSTSNDDLEQPIILVVLHKKASSTTTSSSSRMSFGAGYNSADYEASPFILSLTRQEASTVEGIRKVLIKQYARVTEHSQELFSYFENENENKKTEEVVVNDSTTTRMELDDPASPPPPLEASSSTTASPSSPSSSKTMFTLSVSKNSSSRRSGGSLPLDQTSFNAEMEPLESRIINSTNSRSGTVDEDYDMFTSNKDEKEEKEPEEEKVQESNTSTAETIISPLIKTGDYLVVDWDTSAYEYFFGSTSGKWEETVTVVDPSLEQRRLLKNQKQTITLDQCLTEFTKEEKLGEEDMWYCSSCKDFKQASKKVEIWKTPDVLVFALKRFSSGRYSRDKIDDFVEFPLEGFDMEPFVQGDKVEKRLLQTQGEGETKLELEEPDSLLYDLYAVSNHFGGLGGGHYTAFAKNPENNQWYDFDDSRVTPIEPSRVVSSAAYLLFYRRRTARPIGGAKSIQMVESALQSRQVSLQPSPFGSSDNLPQMESSSVMPGSFEQPSSSSGGGGGGFMGMFQPRTLTSLNNNDNNDNEDSLDGDLISSNGSNEPPSPKSSLSTTENNVFSSWDQTPQTPPRSPSSAISRPSSPRPLTTTTLPSTTATTDQEEEKKVKEIKLDKLKNGQELNDIE
ncbi:hypothetical protein JCM5350_004435 [Sporobolomyces pararoseus]